MPAFATQDGWPALYDVSGVASDDVLNVRAEPDPRSEVIGTLPHDGRDIEILRPNDDFTWGRVNLGERSGWISLDYVERNTSYWDGQFPALRNCFGTEPFWSLAIDGDDVLFETPENSASGHITEQISSLNRRDRHAFTFRLSAKPGEDDFATVSMEQCSDGMSDREFAIGIDILSHGTVGRELISGCCSIQPPSRSR